MKAAKQFFHQQFYRTYLALIALIFIGGLAAYGYIIVQEDKLTVNTSSQFLTTDVVQQQILLRKAQYNINHLMFMPTAIGFVEHHTKLTQYLAQLAKLNKKYEVTNFPYLANKADIQKITKIAQKDSANQKIILQSIKDIEQAAINFETLIALKVERADDLFRLIKNDRVNDRVTATRSRAYAELINNIASARMALTQLHMLEAQINFINLQTNESVIENWAQYAETFFTWFHDNKNEVEQESKALANQFILLERLLLIDDRMIAKWRGHLRVYNEYKVFLVEQNSHLQSIAQQLQPTIKSRAQYINAHHLLPDWLQAELVVVDLVLTHKIMQRIAIGIVIICSVFIFLIILRTNRIIKESANQNIVLIEQCLKDNGQLISDVKSKNIEQDKIISLLKNAFELTINEQKMKQMLQQYEQSLSALFTYHKVCYWQLKNEEKFQDIHFALAEIAKNSEHEFSRLRDYFNADSVLAFLKVARQVKQTQQPQELVLTLHNDKKLFITLNYQHFLYGTLGIYHEPADELLANNKALIEDLSYVRREKINEQHIFSQRIYEKVTKAMLQSQAECLTRKSKLPSVYRQLFRLFTWSQEIKLQTQLEAKTYQLVLQDVCLQEQILSVLNNMAFEGKSQKNISQFNDQMPSLYQINIDPVLFSALISVISRVMLTGQHNSHLALTTKLRDKKDGQHVVGYQFNIQSNQAQQLVPDELTRLIDGDQQSSEQKVALMRLLFDKLHVSNVDVNTTEQGYQLSFELPHTLANHLINQETISDFLYKNFFLLSFDSVNQYGYQLLESSLLNANAKVTLLDDVAQAQDKLTEQQIVKEKIHAVILLASENDQNIQLIEQAIDHLPSEHQPKLYILSDKVNASLLHRGIYSQVVIPFNKYVFLSDLQNLLESDVSTNLTYPITEHDIHYVHTGIEVLFATTNFSQHFALIQLLHYMGFQLTFTATEQQMLQQWQTGRYLILFSELTCLPVIDLDNGKHVQRGLFGFNHDDVEHWQQEAADKPWQITSLTNDISMPLLAEKLSTWLVKKDKFIQPNVVNLSAASNKGQQTTKSLETLVSDSLTASFDIEKFADNHAGHEFAIMMLDEYIAENTYLIEKLSYALSVKSLEHAVQYLTRLTINAKILSAEALINVCQQIMESIEQKHYQDAQLLLPHLEIEALLVAEYAEAI